MKSSRIYPWILVLVVASFSLGSAQTTSPTTPSAATFPTLSAEALQQLLEAPDGTLAVLDVRRADEFSAGHVAGAVHVPHDEIGQRLGDLQPYKDRAIVVYCESGRRAMLAAEALRTAGFQDVRLLEGHMKAWRARNLPLTKPPAAADSSPRP